MNPVSFKIPIPLDPVAERLDRLVAALHAQTAAIEALAASNMALVDRLAAADDGEGDDGPPEAMSRKR